MNSEDSRRPGHDKPAVSEERRAMWELEARTGRVIDGPIEPSRTSFGKLLDFFDSIARAGRGNHWR